MKSKFHMGRSPDDILPRYIYIEVTEKQGIKYSSTSIWTAEETLMLWSCNTDLLTDYVFIRLPSNISVGDVPITALR